MVKTLSRKFIVTSMWAITILLVLLIGAINTINYINTNNRSWESLDKISKVSELSRRAPEGIPQKPDNKPGEQPPMQNEMNEYDTYMASNFFFVDYSEDGELLKVDVSRTSQVSEEDAEDMAKAVIESGETEGKSDNYIYKLRKVEETGENTVLFLDVSNSKRVVRNVLGISSLVGLFCWLLMLLVTTLLSKKAIKPIAENIERQKQFVTDAGHELKTPLAIIQANAEAMELYNGESKWSNNIKLQVERLSKLTHDLLSLAKMDETQNNSKNDSINLSEEFEAILDGFGPACDTRGLTISSEIDSDIKLRCNRADIEKLMGILVDNAVKYAKEESEIRVKLKRETKNVTLSVENECDELPDVEPEKLFERFYRFNKARTQESGGCGIGLSIAQSIVNAHGGSLRAKYVGEKSIRFTAEL